MTNSTEILLTRFRVEAPEHQPETFEAMDETDAIARLVAAHSITDPARIRFSVTQLGKRGAIRELHYPGGKVVRFDHSERV